MGKLLEFIMFTRAALLFWGPHLLVVPIVYASVSSTMDNVGDWMWIVHYV